MTKDQFSAYLAGVIDSDGSFSISQKHKARKKSNYNGVFQLTWTVSPLTLAFMKKLVSIYGGSFFIGKKNLTQFPNSRPVIKYCICSKKVVPLIIDVLPFLHLKRKQARNILRLRSVVRHYRKGVSKSNRIIAFEQKLYELNKELNTKNGTLKCA